MNTTTHPPALGSPARYRFLVGLVVVLALTALGLTACDTTPSENTAARILPADTQAFTTVALSPSVKQKTALFRLSRHFPENIKADDKDDVNQNLLTDAVDQWDLDYDVDVKPWIGGEAAFAAIKPTDEESAPLALGLLKVKDKDKARETFERKQLDSKQYRFIGEYVALVDDGDLHRSPEKAFDAIEAVQKGDATALNDTPKYKDALASLHGEHLALGWVDVPALFDTIGEKEELGYYEDVAKEAKAHGTLAFNLYATDSELVLQAVTEHEGTKKQSVTRSELLKRLPADTIAAVDVNDIGGFLRQQINGFRTQAEPLPAEAAHTFDTLEKLAGSLDGEVVGVLSSDGTPKGLSYAAIAQTTDMSTVKSAITDLVTQLRNSGGYLVTEGSIEGGTTLVIERKQPSYGSFDTTYQSAQLSDPSKDDLTIAFSDDKVIMSNSEDYAEELASSLRGPAGENPVANVGDHPTTMLGFVNLASVMDLALQDDQNNADESGKTEDRKRKDEENRAWAKTLEKFSGHAWNQDGRSHAELRLSFK